MKNTKKCPKCSGTDILRFNGHCGAYGAGNNLFLGTTVFSTVNVNRYLCADCGYSEEWIDEADLKRCRGSRKAIPINETE